MPSAPRKPLLRSLRELVKASEDESLMVISNGIFLGLIRELAEVPPAAIKRSALVQPAATSRRHRQHGSGNVPSALLRHNLPEVIRLRGRDFVPKKDEEVEEPVQEPHILLSMKPSVSWPTPIRSSSPTR